MAKTSADMVAEKIELVLQSQKFYDFYVDGMYASYIRGDYPKGDKRQPTKAQVLKKIKTLFGLWE